MCGRFTLHSNPQQLALKFGCEFGRDLPTARYNIAPTQPVAAVRTNDARQRECTLLRWGLIPSWAKEAKIGSRMINARAETVAEKPSFRAAFRRRRCLILTDGYYEWKKVGRAKVPHLFTMRDEQPFAFAGLWEAWRDPATENTIESCTIITTEANELARPIHDRMPVILDSDALEVWLDSRESDIGRLMSVLRPFDPEAMTTREVASPGRPGEVP